MVAGGTMQRVVGVPGAILLGLGSILGTGVFVGLGVAAEVGGRLVLPAIGLAALVALCNGLSSASLAASHPVSGGTYAYGRRYLAPWVGFLAGWTFLCAKSASAATAGLGVAAYVLGGLGVEGTAARVGVAVAVVAAVTALAASGLRRSNAVNAVLVATALATLAAFVVAATGAETPAAVAAPGDGRLFEAAALVFVAFTGYGRVATLGEEIRDPGRSIPRAVVATLAVTTVVYLAVAWAAVRVAGAGALAAATAAGDGPLAELARAAGRGGVARAVEAGAVVAMLGVLLNLVLGLSRVAFAMGRDGELPGALGRLDAGSSPRAAVVAVGAVIAGLALFGRVETTWSLSAFTVLVYYAVTNVAALRLPPAARRGGPWVPWAGLVGCLGLAAWVDPRAALGGAGILAAGLAGRALARGRR